MNIQQLTYIVALDRYQHFGLAAEHCHITQATLSTMVKRLEEELGVTLFDRKSSPILTTECGQEIVVQARRVLNELEQLKTIASLTQNNISGKLHLGIIPTVASTLLPIVLKPLLERYPQLEIEVSETTTQGLIRRLKAGDLDAGILATPLGQADLEEEVMYYEALWVYGSGFEADKQFELSAAVRSQPLWLLEQGHCLRTQFLNLCALDIPKNQPHNLSFEANSLDTLLNMVDTFGGLTLLPELYARQLSAERKQKLTPFQGDTPVREISMVFYRPYAKFRLIQTLLHEIRERIPPLLTTHFLPKSKLNIMGL